MKKPVQSFIGIEDNPELGGPQIVESKTNVHEQPKVKPIGADKGDSFVVILFTWCTRILYCSALPVILLAIVYRDIHCVLGVVVGYGIAHMDRINETIKYKK